MIELKDYQKRAVRELKRQLVDLLNDDEDRLKLIFKAPTGAGKTVMASKLLDEVTYELPMDGECKYTQVAWVWIAPNKLHQQSYKSMKNFFSETRSLRPVMFDECNHLEGLEKGDVLFLNWESINKDNAVMIRDNEQNRTLYELIRRTKVEKHLPVVVVIDEEHMFGGRNAKKSEMVLRAILPKVEIRISATPVTQSYYNVVVKRKDVVEEEMIKRGIQLNPNIHSSKEQSELTVNQRLLKQALKKREELAKAYMEHGINPLLLIQLPNDSSESMNANDKTIADEMKSFLEQRCNISVENGKLAVWLSKDKSPNLQDITKPDDMTEVLLFKQAIALGWDCPRASVLLIFRDLKSMTFTTQTVGRILRMPEQRFYQNDLLNYGYVYTNLSADIIQIVGDDMNYLSTIYANRRKELQNITLRSVYMDKNGVKRNRLGSTFRSVLEQVMEEEWGQNPLLLFKPEDMFGKDEDEIDADSDNEVDIEEKIRYNRLQAKKHGVRCDVTRIMVDIPKDTRITKFDGTTEITEKARLARNGLELMDMFTKFCRDNCGSFAKFDSTPVLMGALEHVMENYLGIFSMDVPKVVLQRDNKPHFESLIRVALVKYERQLEKQKPAEQEYKECVWEVPETRLYNSQVCQAKDGEIFNHALQPFFEQNNVSAPEYNFARWLDQRTDEVDWWYKNGDEGKQHFAVPYTDMTGRKRCFYVDFIIRLKNGTICLFDTKTPGSDEDAPEKNNALFQYCEEYCAKGKKMVGGVLIAQGDNWYYPNGLIKDTATTDGWSVLDLRNM
ncbi:MAG: DEAD/DEAH box helicase family protein [Bacteroidaceae bacterium]|nr:DEAD/DEAH box helicase family protein [Bacteroidaceae bacterium]